MNPTGFLSPSFAWLFLLVVPLVIVYFLKLKRPRLEIPSLVLWHSVINDQRVNSPFQRFKKHLLLWLQLVILLSLIFAAMQPFLRGGPGSAENLPILIDCSASMAATDTEGGPTRLERAKQRVEELIDGTLPDRVCLIAISDSARQLTEFTNNKRVLRKALGALTVRDVSGNLADGLRMAQALARRETITSVTLVSDGNFGSLETSANGQVIAPVDIELPFELKYERLQTSARNMGITAFNARRQAAVGSDESLTPWNVFVRVDGSPAEETSGEVVLEQDGQEIGRQPIALEPGQSKRLVYSLESSGVSNLVARILADGFDGLETDNTAYLTLPVSRSLFVWCDSELESYRHALGVFPGVVVYPGPSAAGQPDLFDLAITETTEKANPNLEASVRLVVGQIPEDLSELVTSRTGNSPVVDWNRSSLLLQHVNLDNIEITDLPVRGDDVLDQQFREAGYDILATGRTGPLVLARHAPGRETYYLLFHTDRSTLPYRVGFPVLVKNVIDISQHAAGLAEVQGQPTRVLDARTLEPNQAYTVTGPGASDQEFRTGPDGVLSGIPAPRVGIYRIRGSSGTVATVGASVLDAGESSLASADEIVPRDEELRVGASTTTIDTNRPLWPTLAWIAFVVLLVEWWYFQRMTARVAS
jgi:hypothetical protein